MPVAVHSDNVRGRGGERPFVHRNEKMLGTTRTVVQVALTLFTTLLSFYAFPVALACISSLGSAFFIHCIMNCIDSASRSYIPQEDGNFLIINGNALPTRRHFRSQSSTIFTSPLPDTHFSVPSSQINVGIPGSSAEQRTVAGSGHRPLQPSASSSSSSSSSFLASASSSAPTQQRSPQINVGIPGSRAEQRPVAGSGHRPLQPSSSSSSSSSSSFLASASSSAPTQQRSPQINVGVPGSSAEQRPVAGVSQRAPHPSASSSSSSSSSFLASTSVAPPSQPSSQVGVGTPGGDTALRVPSGQRNGGT